MSMIIHAVAISLIVTLAAITVLGVVRDRRAARRITDLEGQISTVVEWADKGHSELMDRLSALESLIRHGCETADYAVGFVDGIRAGSESASQRP